MKFERNVTIVGRDAVVYKATVSPETLAFGSKGEKKSYTLAITYKGNENKTVSYGELVWFEQNKNTSGRKVPSPIVLSPAPAPN